MVPPRPDEDDPHDALAKVDFASAGQFLGPDQADDAVGPAQENARLDAMTTSPHRHTLGRIDILDLPDTPALSRDVTLDIDVVQAAWPEFEKGFDSLQGRKMMGLVFSGNDVYRMSSVRLDRDDDNPLALDETTIPGGSYLRLRLRGSAPEVYGQISPAFDALFDLADHDPTRPHIEYYKREGEVDCLVPILAVKL